MAIPVAIALLLVAALVITALSVTVRQSISGAQARSASAATSPVVDTAVTILRNGLESDAIGDFNDYEITPTNADRFGQMVSGYTRARMRGGRYVGMSPVFHVEKADGGRAGRWQVVRTVLPQYTSAQPNLVLYIKAWSVTETRRPSDAPSRGTDANASRPRYFRVEFRPGYLSNYQLVVNGPIKFVSGATIDGPVHSNGFEDADLAPPGGSQIWAEGSITCTSRGLITTAQKTVHPSVSWEPDCRSFNDTKVFVNLLNTEDSYARIQRACRAARDALCFNRTLVDAHGSGLGFIHSNWKPDLTMYKITLDGDKAVVTVRTASAVSVPLPWAWENPAAGMKPDPIWHTGDFEVDLKTIRAIHFADSVQVSGHTSRRVTISARRPIIKDGSEAYPAGDPALDPKWGASSGSASIYVVGDTYSEGDGIVGLVAQGDIIMEAYRREDGPGYPCVRRLKAAMIAATGALTVDPRFLTTVRPSESHSCSEKLEIEGAIAAHRSPTLYWKWTGGGKPLQEFGFEKRSYSFDERLIENPPPYFPLSGRWEPLKADKASDDDCKIAHEFGGSPCV